MDLDADFQAFESGGSVQIPGNPRNNINKRQNNPFGIKGKYWGATGTGTRDFAIYATPEAGWQAGLKQLALDHSRPFTIRQFQEKYAPTYENPTYLRDLTRMTGTSPDDPISRIPLNTLIQSIAKLESGARGPLPGGDFKGVEKVAAKTKKVDLDADFEAFEQQYKPPPAGPAAVAQVAPQAAAGAPAAKTPWYIKAGRGALEVLDAPHKYISEPVAKKIASYIPEGTVKMAPFAESGEVSREPIDFSPKEFVEKAGPTALDFPVYKGVGSLIGLGGKALGLGRKLPKAVPTPSPAGGPTASTASVSEAEAGLEELLGGIPTGEAAPAAAPAAVGAAPLQTPPFLQPATTPWAAGMTHPRVKGMTEGGFERRFPPGPRQNLPPATPTPSPRQSGSNLTPQEAAMFQEFEMTRRMGGRGFAPPSRLQKTPTFDLEKVKAINEKAALALGKGDPEKVRLLRLIKNLDKLDSMGNVEELPWKERLLDLTRKHY